IHLPASPRIALNGIHEFRLDPRPTAVSRYLDARDVGFAGPCRAGNRVDAVRFKSFVHAWSRDLGLDLDFSQRTPDRVSIQVVPIPVVRGLPITPKRLAHGVDTRQPLDGRHAVVTGDDGAHWVSVIDGQIATVHLVGK